MDNNSGNESKPQISIEDRVVLNHQEKTYYDSSLRQSYILLTNAGYEVGPDDVKKLEQGLKLVIEATRPLQNETNALEYFSLSYTHDLQANINPRHKDFYIPGNTAPYNGQNHSKEVPAYVAGTTIKYEDGTGKVFEFLLFPTPEQSGEGLQFGSIIGSQEYLYNKTKNEYYFGPLIQVSPEDQEKVKKAIVESGIFTKTELDFFVAKSRTQ